MPYIGRGIESGQHIKQTITVSGSPNTTTVYAMDLNASQNSLLVVYGGVIQEPGIAYTTSATNITFTSAPLTGTSLYIIYLGQELTSISNPTTAQVTTIAIDQAAAMALALGG
jgi:hypothetical protein